MTTASVHQIRRNVSPTPKRNLPILRSATNMSTTSATAATAAAAAAPNSAPIHENPNMKLEIETRQLQRSWREFLEYLPFQDQQQLQLQLQRLHQPDELVREIADDIQYWSSHRQRVLFRKSIKWAQKCLEKMESHTILMQTLPDSKYRDTFFGVVYSVVKASREQYRVAEAFLKFLARINDAVASAVRIDCSTELAAALYGKIFLFLGEFLRDYISKARSRLLYSHNEDFKSNFKNLVTSVETLALMQLGATYVHVHDGICGSYTCIEDILFDKFGLEGAARKHTSQTTAVIRLILDTRKQKAKNSKLFDEHAQILEAFLASLQAQVIQRDIDGEQYHRSGTIDLAQQQAARTEKQKPGTLEATPKRRLLKALLQHESSLLQDCFDNNEQIYPFGPDQKLEIPASVATDLFNWTQTNPSLPLAIEGSSALKGSSDRFTLVSACYLFIARRHNIPVISHFCASSPRPTKKAGLIALVYSLIRQLIELAPPMLDCDCNCDLSNERFRRLNGTISSWNDALSILDTLLKYRPPVLICVIDSLDVLEEDAAADTRDQTEHYIKSLVNVLSSHAHPIDPTATTLMTSPSMPSSTQEHFPLPPPPPPSSLPPPPLPLSFAFSTGPMKTLFTTANPCRALRSSLINQKLGQIITTDTLNNDHIDEDGDTNMIER